MIKVFYFRKDKSISRRMLANELFKRYNVIISARSLQKFENGNLEIHPKILEKLSDFYGVSENEITTEI